MEGCTSTVSLGVQVVLSRRSVDRTCWDCGHRGDHQNHGGLGSWCHLWDNEIEDEGMGSECEDWEE